MTDNDGHVHVSVAVGLDVVKGGREIGHALRAEVVNAAGIGKLLDGVVVRDDVTLEALVKNANHGLLHFMPQALTAITTTGHGAGSVEDEENASGRTPLIILARSTHLSASTKPRGIWAMLKGNGEVVHSE